MTHDAAGARPGSRSPLASGMVFALVSAASFGLSGALARGLLDGGWSAGAIVLVRVAMAAVVVAPFAVLALRGRWGVLRRNAGLVLAYGAVAVAGCQFFYFSAVAHLPVGTALLLEYTAPAVVVLWLWLRRGQRPGRLTLLGAGLAAAGLVLVLDLLSGAGVDLVGVLWGLGAMLGLATYFLISADLDTGLPPLVLAGGGLVVGSAVLGGLGATGLLPMRATTEVMTYDGRAVAWWLPLLGLGLVTAALAYTTGIAAARRLGSRLASFVALVEVVFGAVLAWLILGEVLGPLQVLGGGLILLGIVAVKLGEPSAADAERVGDHPLELGQRGTEGA